MHSLNTIGHPIRGRDFPLAAQLHCIGKGGETAVIPRALEDAQAVSIDLLRRPRRCAAIVEVGRSAVETNDEARSGVSSHKRHRVTDRNGLQKIDLMLRSCRVELRASAVSG
jgi:hypothetical protein